MHALLFLIFLFFSSMVSAETISATSSPATRSPLGFRVSDNPTLFPSAAAACASVTGLKEPNPGGTVGYKPCIIISSGLPSSYNASVICPVIVNAGGSYPYSSLSGSFPALTCNYAISELQCPPGQNWTLSGTQCTRPDCVAPATRKADGTCGVTCPAAGTSTDTVGARYWSIPGGASGCLSGTLKFGGCAIKCSGGSGLGAGGAAQAVCTQCKFNGQEAGETDITAGPVPPNQVEKKDTPDACIAQGKGYLTNSSGITVCLDGKDMPSNKPLETVKNTEVKKVVDGVETTTTTKDTVKCADGQCVVERDTTSTTNGVTSTKKTTAPMDQFCEENPNSSVCKATDDPCKKEPDRVGCAEFGKAEDSDGGVLPTQEQGPSSIIAVTVPSNNSCPAPVALPKGGSFSWQPICDFAGWFRYLVLAFAWLGAGFIVLGGTRN